MAVAHKHTHMHIHIHRMYIHSLLLHVHVGFEWKNVRGFTVAVKKFTFRFTVWKWCVDQRKTNRRQPFHSRWEAYFASVARKRSGLSYAGHLLAATCKPHRQILTRGNRPNGRRKRCSWAPWPERSLFKRGLLVVTGSLCRSRLFKAEFFACNNKAFKQYGHTH